MSMNKAHHNTIQVSWADGMPNFAPNEESKGVDQGEYPQRPFFDDLRIHVYWCYLGGLSRLQFRDPRMAHKGDTYDVDGSDIPRPTTWMVPSNPVNKGISTTSTGDRRHSEPSTVCKTSSFKRPFVILAKTYLAFKVPWCCQAFLLYLKTTGFDPLRKTNECPKGSFLQKTSTTFQGTCYTMLNYVISFCLLNFWK